MKKKVLTVFLAFALCSTCVTPVFASEGTNSAAETGAGYDLSGSLTAETGNGSAISGNTADEAGFVTENGSDVYDSI
ncbi:MAG: hypothetical protein HUJ73_02565, partial [Eubacterium sp.]|nr:hypothetical protein [Eubacterium sp.]